MSDPTEFSTRITWTMHLADAALITKALAEAAGQRESGADYLESDRYAADRREQHAKQQSELEEADRTEWTLSEADRERIASHRYEAARLRRLLES